MGVINGSRKREEEEHRVFMDFYRELVKIVPAEVAKAFKNISVPTVVNGVLQEHYRLELNAVDFMWWESVIQEGGRFKDTVSQVQRDVWDRLSKFANTDYMTEEEKSTLMDLVLEVGRRDA